MIFVSSISINKYIFIGLEISTSARAALAQAMDHYYRSPFCWFDRAQMFFITAHDSRQWRWSASSSTPPPLPRRHQEPHGPRHRQGGPRAGRYVLHGAFAADVCLGTRSTRSPACFSHPSRRCTKRQSIGSRNSASALSLQSHSASRIASYLHPLFNLNHLHRLLSQR